MFFEKVKKKNVIVIIMFLPYLTTYYIVYILRLNFLFIASSTVRKYLFFLNLFILLHSSNRNEVSREKLIFVAFSSVNNSQC